MPTSEKLIAAMCLALIGGMIAELIKPQLPYGFDPGRFTWVCAALGVTVGWRVMARRAGRSSAFEVGLFGVVALVFWGLLFFGMREMLNLAMRHKFSEPIEALEHVVTLAIEYAAYLNTPGIIATLVVGGILSGYLTNFSKRRWG